MIYELTFWNYYKSMTYGSKLSDSIEMMNVNVNKDAEQPTEKFLAHGLKILGKRHADRDRKQTLVVYLLLDPVHEQRNVLGRRQMRRLLVRLVVAPQVLVLRSARHHCARLLGAVVGHDAVE